MKFPSIYSMSLCLLATFTLGACDGPAPAADDAPIVTPSGLGLEGEWTEVDDGLWVRDIAGEPTYVGIGEAGQQHAIASLERAEEDLQRALVADEREETRAQLEDLDALLTDLRASETAPDGEPTLRCNPVVTAAPDAYPSTCGVSAKATASYSHCVYSGTVRSYAQVTCGAETKTHQCGPKSGKAVSCSATASIVGAAPCKSYAYAQITAPGVNVYVWDENLVRGTCTPPPPPPPECDCPLGKSCHCGDGICRADNTYCP